MTILFVGSNPSNSSMTDSAFHGSTKSSQILTEWTKKIEACKVYVNVLNKKTENNRALKASEIEANLDRLAEDIKGCAPNKIVALGKTASKALTLLRVEFFEMPHPSGMNRQLNDKEFTARKIKELAEFCNKASSNIKD